MVGTSLGRSARQCSTRSSRVQSFAREHSASVCGRQDEENSNSAPGVPDPRVSCRNYAYIVFAMTAFRCVGLNVSAVAVHVNEPLVHRLASRRRSTSAEREGVGE